MLWYVVVRLNGGETGIRTLEGVATLPVFKTGAFNRSAISPTRKELAETSPACQQALGLFRKVFALFGLLGIHVLSKAKKVTIFNKKNDVQHLGNLVSFNFLSCGLSRFGC